MPDERSNPPWLAITLAVITSLTTLATVYMSNRNAELKEQLAKCQEGVARLPINSGNGGGHPSPSSSNSAFAAKTTLPDSARAGAHFILLESVIGNSRDHTVTANFKLTNEQADRDERIYMARTIGIAKAVTYHAQRAVLDNAPGEGANGASGYARLIKGEPLNASVTLIDVPTDVAGFSTFIISTEGDEVRFKNMPITWQ